MEVDLTVAAGEVGVCVVHRDFKQISGKRVVRAESGRNGQSNETVSSARISRVALPLPR